MKKKLQEITFSNSSIRNFKSTGVLRNTFSSFVVNPKAVISHIDQSEKEKNGDKYKDACRMLGVVPISHLISKLSQNEIRICGYGLGSRGTRALAVALVVSSPFVLLFLE